MQQRYRHLPYWYTLFWKHYLTGEPVIRPLSYEYSTDINTFDIDDEFLVGSDVLVHPVTEELATNVTVYFPGGEHEIWYNIDDFNSIYRGRGTKNVPVTLDTTPVFYRGGSIVPVKQTVRSTSQHMKDDPLTLLVFLDKYNNARGNVYDDDQASFDYLSQKYTYVKFNFVSNTLHSEIIDKEAWYDETTILDTIVVYGLKHGVNQVYIQSKTSSSEDTLFQNMYPKNVTVNKNSVSINDLNLDIRYEITIGFDNGIPKSE